MRIKLLIPSEVEIMHNQGLAVLAVFTPDGTLAPAMLVGESGLQEHIELDDKLGDAPFPSWWK